MDVSPQEEKAAHQWFFIVGIIAVGFSVFLSCVDFQLRNSDREEKLGAALKELRSAQTALGAGSVDERQLLVTGR